MPAFLKPTRNHTFSQDRLLSTVCIAQGDGGRGKASVSSRAAAIASKKLFVLWNQLQKARHRWKSGSVSNLQGSGEVKMNHYLGLFLLCSYLAFASSLEASNEGLEEKLPGARDAKCNFVIFLWPYNILILFAVLSLFSIVTFQNLACRSQEPARVQGCWSPFIFT